MKNKQASIQSTFYIKGMHCPSCEILIEKRIIKEPTVNMVDTDLSKNMVTVEHQQDDQISAKYLSKIFKEDHYRFSNTPFHKNTRIATDSYCAVSKPKSPFSVLFIADGCAGRPEVAIIIAVTKTNIRLARGTGSVKSSRTL